MAKPTRHDVLNLLAANLTSNEEVKDVELNLYEPLGLRLTFREAEFYIAIRRKDPQVRRTYFSNKNRLQAQFKRTHLEEYNSFVAEAKSQGMSSENAATYARTKLRTKHSVEWKRMLREANKKITPAREAFGILRDKYKRDFYARYEAKKLIYSGLSYNKVYGMVREEFLDYHREEYLALLDQLKD